MHMDVKSPAHSLIHTPAVPKKKNRVEGRVEHGTSKSNIYSLLLLVLHVHCLLAGALIRCFIAAAHDRQIAPGVCVNAANGICRPGVSTGLYRPEAGCLDPRPSTIQFV